MSFNWQTYSLNELRAHATHSYRQGGGSRPDVQLIEIDGHKAVLKDQNGADPLFAKLIGPLLNWRETKALKKLANVQGIPNLLAKPDARSFLMSYHDAAQITKVNPDEIDLPAFFNSLKGVIDEVHQHGVAHNDLRNPTNILLDQNQQPILVDLVAAYCKSPNWNLPGNWLFNKFCQVDYSAITKLKNKIAPELVTDDDVVAENIAGRSGMRARAFGQWIRRVSRKLFTK